MSPVSIFIVHVGFKMTRSYFPGRPRRERGIFVSSANNKPLSLDFLKPFRQGLDDFEKIIESAEPEEFKGFSRLEVRECANKYLSQVEVDDAEFLPCRPSDGKFMHGPISSTPKLKKGPKPPIRNLALHFEKMTPTTKCSKNVKEIPAELELPLKRGRGRPPKFKSTEVINQVKKEQKKRGRKRKVSVALFEEKNNNNKAESPTDDKKEIIWKSVVNVVDEFLQQQLRNLQFPGNNGLISLESLMDQTKSLAARYTNYA